MNIRIGHGYDVHRFSAEVSAESNCYIVLGGTKIPHDRRLLAHSDGDVVIHALCDAILGGMGTGDIGSHFPDTDERYRNIDSGDLLSKVVEMARQNGLELINADITVVAQAPKLSPYRDAMREKLSNLISVDKTCINIKATTSEGLGFAGRQEGIATYAVILLGGRCE